MSQKLLFGPVLAVLVIASLADVGSAKAASLPPTQVPQLVTMTNTGVVASRNLLAAGDSATVRNVNSLVASANTALNDPITTVMTKVPILQQPGMLASLDLPANFDPHEYLSLNTYLANGQRNPNASEIPDINYLQGSSTPGLITDTATLSGAYYFTGNQAYATQAAAWLQAWFVTPATRMNPNLTYAQLKVGDSSGQGVIDAHWLPQVLDAMSLISGSNALSADDVSSIESWFSQYLTWLTTSTQGQTEGNTSVYFNNRASWYRAQVVAIAAYLGQTNLAKTYANQGKTLIDHQIAADGTQSEELIRGQQGEDPWNYSYLNLEGLTELGNAAQLVNVDLFSYTNPAGANLATALRLLVPYAEGTVPWPNGLTFKDPNTGAIDPVIQNGTPHLSLVNLPVAQLGRVYTTDTTIQAARPLLKPVPLGRLEFPAGS